MDMGGPPGSRARSLSPPMRPVLIACMALLALLSTPVRGDSLASEDEPPPEEVSAPPPVPLPLPREIGAVQILGLQTLEEPFVRLSIDARTGTTWTTVGLTRDLAALRGTGLFRSVSGHPEPMPDGRIRVVLELEEAPPLRSIRVEGATRIDARAVQREAERLIEGVPDVAALGELARDITRRYEEAGLFASGLSSVEPFAMSTGGDLVLRVVEPRLAEVLVSGTRRVSAREIRRHVLLKPGEFVTVEDMQRSVRQLAKLGTLRSAAFEIERLSPDEREVTLRLDVEEEPYFGELSYGLRFERVNGPVVSFGLTRRQVLGSRTLHLDAELGERQSFTARLSSPWAFGLPMTGEVGVHRTEVRREARQQTLLVSRMDEQRTGQALRLSRTFPGSWAASLTFRSERVRAEAVDGFTLVPSLQAIGRNPVHVSYPQDSLLWNIDHGPVLTPLTDAQPRAERMELEFSGGGLLDGPGDYSRLLLEARRLWRLDPRSHLAARAQVGGLFLDAGILPFLERLTLGGSETHRGYQFKELTGDRSVLANLEYRRRLNERFTGVAFADLGNAWDSQVEGFRLRTSLGLGLRVDIRLFELRLDVARATDREGVNVSLGVGQLF